ncbi:MAG: GNAT family N-acetyltransferase [Gemmatimonadaceae bacterium]|nr:GNAT family N-acetyltransferase [Gemmatimonadaceae bacterium]
MLILRPAVPEDVLAVAAVHVRAWQAGYRGLLADDYLDALRPEDRAAHYTLGSSDPNLPATVVAVNDGVVCGFATIGPCPDDGPETGQLGSLHVDPSAWGIGAGRRLIEDARARLHARGFTEAVLWVLVGNERAQRFYRIDGWLPDGRDRTVELWGAMIHDTRFRRRLP